LIAKYLCKANEKIIEEVAAKELYLSPPKIESITKKINKDYPENCDTLINSVALYNRFFKSSDGVNRNWKVVQDFPRLSQDKKTIIVKAWFPLKNKIYKVDILKFEGIGADHF
jgi:hypothetical protein